MYHANAGGGVRHAGDCECVGRWRKDVTYHEGSEHTSWALCKMYVHRKLEYMGMEHVKSAAELYHHAEGVRDSAGHCRGRLAEVGRHRRSGGWGEFAVLR